LAKRKKGGDVRFRLHVGNDRTIETRIETDNRLDSKSKTVYRGAIVCPVCHFTTAAENVRRQFTGRLGGTCDAKLLAVVTSRPNGTQRSYREPTPGDSEAAKRAADRLHGLAALSNGLAALPEETLPYLRSIFNIQLLDVTRWRDLFTPRQLLLLATFSELIRDLEQSSEIGEIRDALSTCLAIAVNKMADFHSTLCGWINVGEKIGHTFGRQALGIIWDYAEANPFANISGSWSRCTEYIAEFIEANVCIPRAGQAVTASAIAQILPDNTAQAIITDPPYYDAVPYADLADFFYVWFKRSVPRTHGTLFADVLSPKNGEIVQLAERNKIYKFKTREYFESLMKKAMIDSRRVLCSSGIGLVVFAHKTTTGWEAQLQAMLDAGWCISASWPIDTERPARLRAMGSAALASSVHLVCRPRSITGQEIGDWRDVLQELPRKIHEWMPRLAEEGIVGADAIFACLGPALEIFSQYSGVEKASGEAVTLKEYLEQVWAAVAKEALAMVFEGADASGFEADARVTAMWLWTLAAGNNGNRPSVDEPDEEEGEEEDDGGTKKSKAGGFELEYDAARTIAQGLGAYLESLDSIVEVRGDRARLLSVAERTRYLFGKEETQSVRPDRKKKSTQMDLFAKLAEAGNSEVAWRENTTARIGETTLDGVHQSMILFAAGRAEALKRFLVEEGVGQDGRFWRLAQALSALFPVGTEEKRWVDGVLARKKGLGL
jgi:putative DNA methylase